MEPTSTGDGDEESDNLPSREQVLSLLAMGLSEAGRKVESGRVYDAENERVRVQWLRALATLSGEYRKLKEDADLDALAERVEKLEREQGTAEGGEAAPTADDMVSRLSALADGEGGAG